MNIMSIVIDKVDTLWLPHFRLVLPFVLEAENVK